MYNTKVGIEKLKSDLKSGNIGRFYTLFGDEDYLKDFYLEQLKAKVICGADEEFCFFSYDMQSFDLQSICDNLESYPFCGGGKLILFENIELPKLKEEDKKQIFERFSELADFVTVVFHYDAMFLQVDYALKTKRTNELRALEKFGPKIEVSLRDKGELTRWIVRHFKAQKLEISPAAAQFLLSYTDNSMANLKTEVEKLACYCEGEVSCADIEKVCSKSFEADIFDVTAAVSESKFPLAIEIISVLKERKTEPLEVLYGVSSVFTEMLYVKSALEAGIFDAAKIVSDFGIKPTRKFLITKYLKMVRAEPLDYYKKCVKLCLRADCELKSGRGDRWIMLERALCEMSLAAR